MLGILLLHILLINDLRLMTSSGKKTVTWMQSTCPVHKQMIFSAKKISPVAQSSQPVQWLLTATGGVPCNSAHAACFVYHCCSECLLQPGPASRVCSIVSSSTFSAPGIAGSCRKSLLFTVYSSITGSKVSERLFECMISLRSKQGKSQLGIWKQLCLHKWGLPIRSACCN